MTDEPSGLELAAELEDLRARLVEAKEVLRAIHNGEVDAVVVTGERGEHVYTLMGADRIYRQLIETMSEGAATLTADGIILYCNVRLAEMLERPLDQVLGTALGNYLPPADQEAVDALLAQARTEPNRREINLRTSEGRLVPVYLSASRLESEGAEIVFCLVLTDLREQKSHEHIVAAERLGRSILDQAAEAIVVCDEQGRIIRASQAAQVLCDGSPLLRPFDGAFPLRTCTSSPFHLTRVLQGETLRNVDVALERQGQKLHLILNAGPLLDGQQVLGCVVTLTDITERKQGETALRENELLTRRLVDHLPQRIFVKDLNSAYVFCNSSYALDLGTEPNQIVGKDDFAFFPQELAERYRADDRAVMTDGTTKEMDERYQTAGEEQSIHTVKIPYRNQQGKITGVLGIFHDITERKRAEEEKAKLEAQLQQAQKMESVGRLAGGVAHDFNNMLGVILGHAELAIAQVDPAQLLHADLTEIRNAAVRSADLTRQLLAFARQQTVSPKVLDLNEAVTGMFTMLQRLISEDIDLAWQPAADLWPVNVDPSQMDQILANLCVNAGDAISGVGKMIIETGNSTLDEDYCAAHAGCVRGEYVRLAVSDDGLGMDTETLSHIFEPFFTTKVLGKGTGLGLATVYGIVKQNNGFIDVDSEPSRGTTFKIYLPRHVDKAGRAGKAGQAPIEGAARPLQRGHETILLVEDELAILTLTKRMLEQQGYTVLAANTPGEAISLAREHTDEIDLLITDVIMPEMNGRVLAKNLLSVYPFLKRLFMSGYTADVIAHRGVLEQGVPFIQKPFSREDLATKVRVALDALD